MPTGYEEIDNLNNQASQLYDKQMEQQKNIINTATDQAVAEIQKNKEKAEREALNTNKALYRDYQKQVNPYGVNAENLYEQGLAKSGLAETTKANYYNTYQNARTEAQNNANQIFADFDNEMARARQNGDLQLAQASLQMLQQKVDDLYRTYGLKYQVGRDQVADDQWQKEYQRNLEAQQWQQAFNQAQFDYNKSIDERNYNYQKERDKIADDQWLAQYNLTKAKSSGGSGRSGGGSSSSGGGFVVTGGTTNNATQDTAGNTNKGWLTQAVSAYKNAIPDYLANAYYNGQIDENQFKQLANKFGLK